LGPLTNIGLALVREPRIASRIKQIVAMGGGYFEQGNVTPAAEFNIYVDPHAARLVLDSGIHARRWSREQAIAYMSQTLGDAESSVTREVERYCVQPGQASSYMLGWRTWTESRARAEKRLGDRFSLKGFHDTGLTAGTMPLDVLASVIDEWKGN
jgi:uncharacterized protein (DUF885 family)